MVPGPSGVIVARTNSPADDDFFPDERSQVVGSDVPWQYQDRVVGISVVRGPTSPSVNAGIAATVSVRSGWNEVPSGVWNRRRFDSHLNWVMACHKVIVAH